MQDQSPGVFLALDDGYGQVTDEVLASLSSQLRQAGHKLTMVDYASPDLPSGYFIARYQAGDYGSDTQRNPYLGVLLQAIDYLTLSPEVHNAVAAGQVVIALNYMTTAVAREAGKFATAPERAAFYLWADQILFDTFRLPRPAKTYVLAGDSTEPSTKARVFAEMAGVLSRDLKLIDCYRNGHRLPDEAVERLLLEALHDMVPEPAARENEQEEFAIWLPDVDDALTREYQETLTDILSLRNAITKSLTEAGVTAETYQGIRELLAPVALDPLPPIPDRPSEVPEGYSQDHRTSRLLAIQPANEHDLLPLLAFAHSDLSTSELRQQIDKQSFERKEAMLNSLLKSFKQLQTLDDLPVSYTFELLTTYEEYQRCVAAVPDVQVLAQSLTPRYEYDLPPVIEEYDLTDMYVECFDKSMTLYSRLEAAGQQSIAANACLRGHKLRWRAHMTYAQLLKLHKALPGSELVSTLLDTVQGRHSTLLELMGQLA